jgi:phenolic acid decarboxylase
MTQDKKAYMKKWRAEHQAHIKEYFKTYRDEHLESERERSRQWRKEHPDLVKAYNDEYNQYRKDVRNEYLKDKCCEDCGSKENLDLHHLRDRKFIISQFKEGDNIEGEVKKCIVLCRSCHQRRHGIARNGLNFSI